METEKWVDVCGYEKMYQVSSFGRIRSNDRYMKGRHGYPAKVKGRMMKIKDGKHYKEIILSKNGKRKTFLLHRLVAIAFIANVENKRCVNHKDGNKKNNNINNLEWVTDSENQKHAYLTNLKSAKGSKNGRSKLKEDDVVGIKALLKLGLWQKQIAMIYGVSDVAICDINTGRRWAHING